MASHFQSTCILHYCLGVTQLDTDKTLSYLICFFADLEAKPVPNIDTSLDSYDLDESRGMFVLSFDYDPN